MTLYSSATHLSGLNLVHADLFNKTLNSKHPSYKDDVHA